MEKSRKLVLILTLSISFAVFIVLALFCVFRRKGSSKNKSLDNEASMGSKRKGAQDMEMKGNLIKFSGGEDLTSVEILDAPGEVIGKSNYGTLYMVNLVRNDSVVCLRFLRPTCTKKAQDLMPLVQLFGTIRHPNLVPLYGFYYGPRGEKLLVHPYYQLGNLAQFIKEEKGLAKINRWITKQAWEVKEKLFGTIRHPNLVPLYGFYYGPRGEKLLVHPYYQLGNLAQFIKDGKCHKWRVISRISTGIAKGLDYLHTGHPNPIIHGNLKSKNILMDQNDQPIISDFGLHAFLKASAAQEMLEAATDDGYKAPELIKMEDTCEATDIYNFGLILLELLTGKEQANKNADRDQDPYLATLMRNVMLDNRISDLYHPDILLDENNADGTLINEERVKVFFRLAMDCCSPSPLLRPDIKQLCRKLEEI
ncbi:putative kinase-like protein TMKL1 [Tanacetum coccineum]